MDTDLILKIASVVAAFLAGTIAAVSFGWLNFREHAKRLEIIEIAKKRVDFWDQALKIQLTATTADSNEAKQAKDKAYMAVQQIYSQANNQLHQLTWKRSIRRQIRFVMPTMMLKPLPNQIQRGYPKFMLRCVIVGWVILMFLAEFFVVLAMNIQWHRGKHWVVGFILMMLIGQFFFYLSASLLWGAKMSKYKPPPDPPLLDSI